MGRLAPYSSLTMFRDDLVVNITVMFLIIIGGIGFIVWDDVYRHKTRFRQYNLHSKVVLSATAILIPLAALLYFAIEQNGVFQGMNTGQGLLAALFQAVTPRTAGFNTVDTAALSEGGSLLTILLMIVGAGTGSTAGGIKTTTLIVLMVAVAANVRRRNDVNIFNRRLEPELVNKAFCVATIHLMLAIISCLILVVVQGFTIKDALFETVSAIGTVGLTKGITRDLIPLARLIIILLMFAGRLGSLSVFMAAADTQKSNRLRYIEGKLMVG